MAVFGADTDIPIIGKIVVVSPPYIGIGLRQ
jgi:hypothetical protein